MPEELLSTRRTPLDPEAASLLRGIGDYLLGEIYGPERTAMLEHCYVEPGIGTEFERNLRRLLKDTGDSLDPADHDTHEGTTDSFISQVVREERHSLVRHPVVVVGNVGVGKTTFLRRSLETLRSDHAAFYALVDLEGRGQGGHVDATSEEEFVSGEILEALRRGANNVLDSDAKRAQANPFSRETLRTVFRDQLKQTRELGKDVFDTDEAAWAKKEFQLLEAAVDDKPQLLCRFIRHLRSSRFKRSDASKFPILIVLDNLDQATDEYQRAVYGYCQRLVRDTPAVIVLCMRETTYRRGRQAGGFLTSSPLQFVFHVAAPPRRQLFSQRVKFGEYAVQNGSLPKRLNESVAEVSKVCDLIRGALLVDKSDALELISGLGGHNVRDTLGLARKMILGWPATGLQVAPSTEFALESLVVGNAGGLEVLPSIANCFDAEPAVPACHALKSRLLAYYSWAFQSDRDRVHRESTSTVLSRFSSWGYQTGLVRRQLRNMVDEGLVREAVAGVRSDETLASRLMLTAAGHVHLTKLIREPNYRALMARATPWFDTGLGRLFVDACHRAGDDNGPTVGDIAASEAPKLFDAYLAHAIVVEDGQLAAGIESSEWVRAVRAGTGGLLPRIHDERAPRGATSEHAGVPAVQLDLDMSNRSSMDDRAEIPSIRRDLKHANTVWIPRILWALEWARLNKLGSRTASEIAAILTAHGDMQIPNTNVARAFRVLKGKDAIEGLWTHVGQRYQIDDAGIRLLQALLLEHG